MSLITVRNPTEARGMTVRAGENLEVGMFVKMVQGSARGAPPAVVKVEAADVDDPQIIIGVVDFIKDDDLAVDFILDPTLPKLDGINTGSDDTFTIPQGEQCVMWIRMPIIGFHTSALHVSIDPATVREPTKLAISKATARLALYDAGQADRDVYVGTLYQNELGQELTVILDRL